MDSVENVNEFMNVKTKTSIKAKFQSGFRLLNEEMKQEK
jgi:hypothetical protein